MYLVSWNCNGTKSGASWTTLSTQIMKTRGMKENQTVLAMLQEAGQPPWPIPTTNIPARGIALKVEDPFYDLLRRLFSPKRLYGSWVPFVGAKEVDLRCSLGMLFTSRERSSYRTQVDWKFGDGFRPAIYHWVREPEDEHTMLIIQVHLVSGKPVLAKKHLLELQEKLKSCQNPTVIVGDMNIDLLVDAPTLLPGFAICAPDKPTFKNKSKIDFAIFRGLSLDVVCQYEWDTINSDHDALIYEIGTT